MTGCTAGASPSQAAAAASARDLGQADRQLLQRRVSEAARRTSDVRRLAQRARSRTVYLTSSDPSAARATLLVESLLAGRRESLAILLRGERISFEHQFVELPSAARGAQRHVHVRGNRAIGYGAGRMVRNLEAPLCVGDGPSLQSPGIRCAGLRVEARAVGVIREHVDTRSGLPGWIEDEAVNRERGAGLAGRRDPLAAGDARGLQLLRVLPLRRPVRRAW